MLKRGMVISIDHKSNTGIIREGGKRDYFFTVEDCQNLKIPELYSSVSFYKDDDYKFTNVAILIQTESENVKRFA